MHSTHAGQAVTTTVAHRKPAQCPPRPPASPTRHTPQSHSLARLAFRHTSTIPITHAGREQQHSTSSAPAPTPLPPRPPLASPAYSLAPTCSLTARLACTSLLHTTHAGQEYQRLAPTRCHSSQYTALMPVKSNNDKKKEAAAAGRAPKQTKQVRVHTPSLTQTPLSLTQTRPLTISSFFYRCAHNTPISHANTL